MDATSAERLTVLAAMPRLPHAEFVVHFDDVIGVLAEITALRASHERILKELAVYKETAAKLRTALKLTRAELSWCSQQLESKGFKRGPNSSVTNALDAAREALAAIPPA